MTHLQTPRRTRAVCLLAATVLLAGCSGSFGTTDRSAPVPEHPVQSSDSNGTGPVTVTGRLLRPDGTAAGSRPVLLRKQYRLRDGFADFFVGSLFLPTSVLSCIASDEPVVSICKPLGFTTATHADGRYAMRLSDSDTRSAFGGRRDLTVDVALPAGSGGGQITSQFPSAAGTLVLPDLRFWQPSISSSGATTRFTPLPASSAKDPSYSLQLVGNGGLVESAKDVGTTARIDGRLLEDTHGLVTVDAAADLASDSTVTADTHWISPGGHYASTAGAPPSRRHGCDVGVEGRPVTAQGACWLTDAQFATPYPGTLARSCAPDPQFPSEDVCTKAAVTSVLLDLGKVTPVGLVVVRGSSVNALVEGSLDKVHWSPLGRLDGETVLSPDGQKARWVRLRTDPTVTSERPSEPDLDSVPIAPTTGGGPAPGFSVPSFPPLPSFPSFPSHGDVVRSGLTALPTYHGDLSGLTELSVWPQPSEGVRTAGSSRVQDSPSLAHVRRHLTAYVLAAVLLLLVMAGGAFAVGTRRR